MVSRWNPVCLDAFMMDDNNPVSDGNFSCADILGVAPRVSSEEVIGSMRLVSHAFSRRVSSMGRATIFEGVRKNIWPRSLTELLARRSLCMRPRQ